jgi:hypothetical protein
MAREQKKSPAQLDREIKEALRSPPSGLTYGKQWPKDRRFMLVNDATGEDMRRAHDFEVDEIQRSRHGVKALELRGGTYSVRLRDMDEKFAVLDRNAKVIGEATTVKGAMAKAPKDQSYAIVRGEYTSDGRYWGLGHGRQLAVREFHPSGGMRWYEG